MLDFGITWTRTHNQNKIKKSAVDHAFTNDIGLVHNYFKTQIDYSDHCMICVDLKTKLPKPINNSKLARDFRKMRSNPKYFLNELAKVNWESFIHMTDVDEMQTFWTSEINKCLDLTAPWKKRNIRKRKYSLPKEILTEIQKRKELQKRHQTMVKNGKLDLVLFNEFKKQKNYCNKVIKKEVREKKMVRISQLKVV